MWDWANRALSSLPSLILRLPSCLDPIDILVSVENTGIMLAACDRHALPGSLCPLYPYDDGMLRSAWS